MRRSTVRPSRRHPLANPACKASVCADRANLYAATGVARPRLVLCAVASPRRSSPACWRRRRPRHFDGPWPSGLSPIGRAACPSRPHAAEPLALHGSAALRKYLLPRLLIPSSFGLPPVVEPAAEPGGEIAAAVEAFRMTDGGDESRRDDRADARNCRQPAGVLVLLVQRMNSASKAAVRRSSSAHCVRASSTKGYPRAQSYPAFSSVRTMRNCSSLRLPFAPPPPFEQDRTQLIDQSRALPHQAVSRSMQRLHVELVLALQFNEPHRRARRRLGDPLGVTIVVLLSLDVGPDIFGRHQPDVVTASADTRPR